MLATVLLICGLSWGGVAIGMGLQEQAGIHRLSGQMCFGLVAILALPPLAWGVAILWSLGTKVPKEAGHKEGKGEPDAPPRRTQLVRMLSLSQAEALVREIAERHGAEPILRQLGRLRREHLANPIASFAEEWDPGETALLLVDTSRRGDCKAGILLSNRRLYSSRLDGPIELQDIEQVTYKDPSEAELVLKVLLFVICFAVGAIFIMLGSWFKRRLQVNDEVVYEGPGLLHGEFWIDVLTALGAAARKQPVSWKPSRIDRDNADSTDIAALAELLDSAPRPLVGVGLETLPHTPEGVPLDGRLIADPTWEQVERSIRQLDRHTHPLVRLWAGAPWLSSGLEIVGGHGRYALREADGGWVYYDPDGGDKEVEVQSSGEGYRREGYYVCTDLSRVLDIVRRFCETGAFEG